MEKSTERGPTIVFSREETKHRRSPPPLVSIESSRRDSLVGLQRLVYGSQIFSSPSSRRNMTPPMAVIGESVTNSQELGTRPTAHLECSHARMPSPKPKRSRTSFTPGQLERLEDEFQIDMYVVGLKRMKLANDLSLSERQVKVWFQNRRMKYKRERSKQRNCEGGK